MNSRLILVNRTSIDVNLQLGLERTDGCEPKAIMRYISHIRISKHLFNENVIYVSTYC